ncbi:hypothetical protein DFH09DRAFT_1331466 [Mycena vulgaris]|nr:hypothetical protein DFH09DRAFT_1331466 [Mycena vulgaris]
MDDDLEFLFADEPPIEPDDSEAHIENEPDDFTLPDDEEEAPDPIQVTHSRGRRARLKEEDIPGKVKKVLETIRDQGLDMAILLDAICWGKEGCISDGDARTGLMVSDELQGILERYYNPPRRSHKAEWKRPAGGRRVLLEFATTCVFDAIDREMKLFANLFLSPPEDLSEENLTSLDFDELKVLIQMHAPILWRIFRWAAYTPLQESRNNADMVVVQMISQAQFTSSDRRGRLWSTYLKVCGLSARAFDALHALGIPMSHKWTANAYGTLSDNAMAAVRILIHEFPWVITHDNLNVALRVFSQRINNQSHFVSGCAYTIWLLPLRAVLPVEMNCGLQIFRAENCGEMEAFDEYHVLLLLLNSPNFSDYPYRSDRLLDPPAPVHQLEGGLENAIKMFILKTSTFEEASYEGTPNVMNDAFNQLLLNSQDKQERTALKRVITCIGDQLKIERLRGLWKYRHEDHNSFDRLDYMIPIFGWFHLVMAFANSLHKQYLHFRASWLDVAKVKKLADLKTKSPQQLRDLAKEIIRLHASREAVNRIDHKQPAERDHIYRQWTMFNMDILLYLALRAAINSGDVDRIEDLMPTLLLRFAGGGGGGGDSKYAIEMLELFQSLQREWPERLRNYITEFCWLMTRTGGVDTWLPFDLGQEQNIADVKVNYRASGPGATTEGMGKISPVILALRKVQRHMEQQFKTNTRGARHS